MEETQAEYESNVSFKSIFYFCSLPLRLDSYNGCTFNCLYCFSQSLNNRKSDFFGSTLKPGNPSHLERLLKLSQCTASNSSILQSCLQHRIPIHLGSVSDPFQHAEKKYKITRDYLTILSKFNYPTIISTKGTLVSAPEYLNLILGFPTIVQNSFSTLDDKLAYKLEPGAPSPSERLKSLEILASAGIWTSIRLQPFLYPFSSPTDIDFNNIAAAGIKHVVLEHLRIPTNSSKKTREILFNELGMNMIEEYKKLGIKTSRINFELATERKIENIITIREMVHKAGMTFGSADNDFHHVSDMPCCCGLPNQKEFENYYKGHLGYSVFESMNSGNVNFNNIRNEWQPTGSMSEYINSDCRVKGIKTPIDFLQYKIDNPNSSNSPVLFAGIEYDNDCGYKISNEFRNRFFHKEE
jgi:DNA repair photolyase